MAGAVTAGAWPATKSMRPRLPAACRTKAQCRNRPNKRQIQPHPEATHISDEVGISLTSISRIPRPPAKNFDGRASKKAEEPRHQASGLGIEDREDQVNRKREKEPNKQKE